MKCFSPKNIDLKPILFWGGDEKKSVNNETLSEISDIKYEKQTLEYEIIRQETEYYEKLSRDMPGLFFQEYLQFQEVCTDIQERKKITTQALKNDPWRFFDTYHIIQNEIFGSELHQKAIEDINWRKTAQYYPFLVFDYLDEYKANTELAEEILQRAAKKAPMMAFDYAKEYVNEPYADKILEIAKNQVLKDDVFVNKQSEGIRYISFFENEPWAADFIKQNCENWRCAENVVYWIGSPHREVIVKYIIEHGRYELSCFLENFKKYENTFTVQEQENYFKQIAQQNPRIFFQEYEGLQHLDTTKKAFEISLSELKKQKDFMTIFYHYDENYPLNIEEIVSEVLNSQKLELQTVLMFFEFLYKNPLGKQAIIKVAEEFPEDAIGRLKQIETTDSTIAHDFKEGLIKGFRKQRFLPQNIFQQEEWYDFYYTQYIQNGRKDLRDDFIRIAQLYWKSEKFDRKEYSENPLLISILNEFIEQDPNAVYDYFQIYKNWPSKDHIIPGNTDEFYKILIEKNPKQGVLSFFNYKTHPQSKEWLHKALKKIKPTEINRHFILELFFNLDRETIYNAIGNENPDLLFSLWEKGLFSDNHFMGFLKQQNFSAEFLETYIDQYPEVIAQWYPYYENIENKESVLKRIAEHDPFLFLKHFEPYIHDDSVYDIYQEAWQKYTKEPYEYTYDLEVKDPLKSYYSFFNYFPESKEIWEPIREQNSHYFQFFPTENGLTKLLESVVQTPPSRLNPKIINHHDEDFFEDLKTKQDIKDHLEGYIRKQYKFLDIYPPFKNMAKDFLREESNKTYFAWEGEEWLIQYAPLGIGITLTHKSNPNIMGTLNARDIVEAVQEWNKNKNSQKIQNLIDWIYIEYEKEKQGQEMLMQYDLPKDQKIHFYCIIPKAYDSVILPTKVTINLMKKSLSLCYPRLEVQEDILERNPLPVLREKIAQDYQNGIRYFALDIYSHGNNAGLHFPDGYVTAQDLQEIFDRYPDAFFQINTVACHGGNLIDDSAQILNGEKDHNRNVAFFTQTKSNIPNLVHDVIKNDSGYKDTTYLHIFMKALLDGKTYGQAHHIADQSVKRIMGINPEALIKGKIIGRGDIIDRRTNKQRIDTTTIENTA